MMGTTLLVPGLEGTGDGHWMQWWLEQDAEAVAVQFTDLGDPVPAAMAVELAEAVLANPGAVLVGHSLGAILMAQVLAEWPGLPVAGALLVAPADPGLHPRLHRFAPLSQRPLPVPALAALSQNDPVMGMDTGRALARAWGARVIDLGQAGHVDRASGHGPWPIGMALRDAVLQPGVGLSGRPGLIRAAE
jgi:hypothetical protein